jgi:accessory gene regulator protein AgrB
MFSFEQSIANDGSNVLYDVMRKEVRQAVEEIRTQFEKVSFGMLSLLNNSFKFLILQRF